MNRLELEAALAVLRSAYWSDAEEHGSPTEPNPADDVVAELDRMYAAHAELLELCKELRDFIEPGDSNIQSRMYDELCAKADAVIAKYK